MVVKERVEIETRFVDRASAQMNKFREKVEKTFNFQPFLLSTLFFGMFIQRVFSTIARGAVTSFTKILESNNMLGSAIQRLGVHFEFLKFTIGSAINTALEPLMPRILEIVNRITEWIQKNPKLTAQIIGWGLAIGTLMFFLSTLFLGLNGIITAVVKFSSVIWAFAIKPIIAFVGWLAAALGISVGWAAAIVAAVVVLVLGVIFNWLHMRDILISVWLATWNNIKTIVMTAISIIKGVFFLFTLQWQEALDEFIKIGEIWKDWWTSLQQHISDIIGFIVDDIRSIISFASNAISKLKKLAGIGGGRGNSRSFQHGGTIPETGPYLLHQGERVIPSTSPGGGGNQSFGNINVTVNTTGGVNGGDLGRQIMEEIKKFR